MPSRHARAPAPADWPNTVTCAGSPPQAWIWSCTHCNAAIWSSKPRLAGALSSSLSKCMNPSMPSRYCSDTNTSPCRANAAPSYSGSLAEPRKKPPPCTHTMTGKPAPSSAGGAHTLTARQSSPPSRGASAFAVRASCSAMGAKVVASRRPDHGNAGTGAAKRSAPRGAWAYGTPRKTRTPWSHRPRSWPPWGSVTWGAAAVPPVIPWRGPACRSAGATPLHRARPRCVHRPAPRM